MEVTVSLDRTVNLTKPTNASAALITKRLKPTTVTTEQLAKSLVLPYGYTFCPAVFSKDGVRRNDAWVSQQIFALDFDNGIAFEDVLKRAIDYGIIPNFAYTSFSANETNNKFRVVWAMNRVITDLRERNVIQDSLLRIFSECDSVCKDASRQYYGGKAIIFENYEATIDAEALRNAFCSFNEESDYYNSSRNITRFAKKHGLSTLNGWPETTQNGRFERRHYSNIYNDGDKIFQNQYVFSDDPSGGNSVKRSIELLRRVDFHRLADECPVFNDFMQGIDVHHAVTWTVMCSLLRLEGGESLFMKGLQLRDEYDERKWERQIKYFKKDGGKYLPGYKYIAEFYPNLETEYANIFQVAESQFGKVRKISSAKEIPLKEAEKIIAETIKQFLDDVKAGRNTLTVLKTPPGSGKTYLLGLALEEAQCDALYVGFSNHRLKQEVAKRFSYLNPQIAPELPKKARTKELEQLWTVGAHTLANVLIYTMAKDNPEFAEFVEKRQSLHPGGLVLGTHAGLLYYPHHLNGIVIDECWIESNKAAKTLEIKDFLTVLHEAKPRAGFRTVDQTAKSSPLYDILLKLQEVISEAEHSKDHDVVFKVPPVLPDDLEVRNEIETELQHIVAKLPNLTSNIVSFMTASQFMLINGSIKYTSEIKLPADKPILIMSATADETLYRNLFGDRLNFVDVGQVESVGKIIMHCEQSFSRSSIKANPEPFNATIKKHKSKGENILTFKDKTEQPEDPECEIPFFGKSAGFDGYKGHNLAVVGTPNAPSWAYVLHAAACGYDMTGKPDMSQMEFSVTSVNGFETRIMIMSDKRARVAQYAHLNGELVQGAGRARALREDVVVHVYSTFPIAGAILAS